MKEFKTRKIEEEFLVKHICDICELDMTPSKHMFSRMLCGVAVLEKIGFMGKNEISYDFCTDCFIDKLVPFIEYEKSKKE